MFSECNKKKLENKILQVKEILDGLSYPYNRRIAGVHGYFKNRDYRKWLEKADIKELSKTLTRLSQLNQPKSYLIWQTLI
jgi:hypothetical protein